MATILERRLTRKDSSADILAAIKELAEDKNHRLLEADEDKWVRVKFEEIARLTSILIVRQ